MKRVIKRILAHAFIATMALTLGIFAIAIGSGVRGSSAKKEPSPDRSLAAATTTAGLGAGDLSSEPARAQRPAGCSLFDVTCWAQQALTTILLNGANPVQQFDQGVVGGFGQGSFITQTPLCVYPLDGCDNTQPLDNTLTAFIAWAQLVAVAALSFLVIIGGLNILVGRQMGMRIHDLGEFIPRLVLTFLAAWTAPMIVQAFIDLNNVLCQSVLSQLTLAAFPALVSTLVNVGLSDGWLIFLFLVMLSLFALALSGQMLFRLAFVAFLAGLAPIGLLCFALPQTLSWGRLWLRNFSVSIFVQFLQVAMLAVGGSMLTALAALASPAYGSLPNANIVLEIVLSIILLYLTIRLPGMLVGWALRTTAEQVGTATIEAAGSAMQAMGQGAEELAALLVA
jgi:hypothetical protein